MSSSVDIPTVGNTGGNSVPPRASLTGSGLHFSWFDLILIGFDRIFVVLIWF